MSNDAERTNLGREDVERRAYELYEQRGREDGHDWDDWLAAERDLRASGAAETTAASTEVASSTARRRRDGQSEREGRREIAQ
jgi:hypothetical protein